MAESAAAASPFAAGCRGFQTLLLACLHHSIVYLSIYLSIYSIESSEGIKREMHAARALVLQHLRLRAPPSVAARGGGPGPAAVARCWFARGMSAPADGGGDGGSGSESAVRARVVELVS